jgi:hypothetical protein
MGRAIKIMVTLFLLTRHIVNQIWVLREIVSIVVNSQTTTAISDAPSISSTTGESLQLTTSDMP